MIDKQGRHFPDDPAKFSFSADVAQVFPAMAVRSIPNFETAHAVHARMAKAWIETPGCRILDIGASRGAFFNALQEQYPSVQTSVRYVAMDASPYMCEMLTRDFPMMSVRNWDLNGKEFERDVETHDIVVCHYTLQFVDPVRQSIVLSKIIEKVKPGGLLIFGHKAAHEGPLGDAAHEEYIRFRMDNGYTEEEIRAKTAALKNSMWPMQHESLLRALQPWFAEIQETTRFMMFNTLVARKRTGKGM